MEVPMGEGRKFMNDPWNIQGFGEMDIRRKNAGKQRPSRDAGMAPQERGGAAWWPSVLTEGAASEGK
jgi:hypothetical protein